jgi:hypothetical protein
MAKSSEKAETPHDPNALVIERKKGQTDAEAIAEAALRPCVNGAMTIKGCSTPSFGELGLTALVGELSAQTKLAKGGSLERVEETLLTQAHTLDALFNHLTRLSLSNSGNLTVMEACMRLGLKAQSQCRATLEALAEIKNPRPVAFIKQANLAQGPQQVNNGVDPSRAGEKESQQNKLSGERHELLPDTRASQVESRIDSPMGAVEEIDGTKVPGR